MERVEEVDDVAACQLPEICKVVQDRSKKLKERILHIRLELNPLLLVVAAYGKHHLESEVDIQPAVPILCHRDADVFNELFDGGGPCRSEQNEELVFLVKEFKAYKLVFFLKREVLLTLPDGFIEEVVVGLVLVNLPEELVEFEWGERLQMLLFLELPSNDLKEIDFILRFGDLLFQVVEV